MKYLQGFERLLAGLMMLAIILLAGDVYMKWDARQAAFEATIATSIAASSDQLSSTLDAKFEELRKDVKAELHPVSASAVKTLDASTALLNTAKGKAESFDVVALNGSIQSAGASLDASTALLNTAKGKAESFDVVALNGSIQSAGASLDATAVVIASTAKPLQASLEQFDAALPDFLDCQVDENGVGNKSCLSIRWADMTSDADKIAADARRYVDKFTAPPTKWERFEAMIEAFGGSLVYAVVK